MNLRTLTFSTLALTGITATMLVPHLRSHADDTDPQPAKTATATAADKPYLGLQLAPVPELLRMHLPDALPSDAGVLVAHVAPDSPAATAGLDQGDVVLSVDGDSVDEQTISQRVADHTPGQTITLEVLRRGQPMNVTVKLGSRPIDEDFADSPWSIPGMPSLDPDVPLLPSGMPDVQKMIDDMTRDHGNLPGMKESMKQMQKQFEQMNEQFKKFGSNPAMPSGKPNSSWSHSQSSTNGMAMNVQKIGDDQFRVSVDYQTDDGEKRELKLVGTAEEVLQAIDDDELMPASVRKQVLGSIQAQASGKLDMSKFDLGEDFPGLPAMKDMMKEFQQEDFDFGGQDFREFLPKAQKL